MASADPYAWVGKTGCCEVLFLADMWREVIIGNFQQFVALFNRGTFTNSNTDVVMGYGVSLREHVVEVEGRFGRRHESPRAQMSWQGIQVLDGGVGTGRRTFSFSTSGLLRPTPHVILRATHYPTAPFYEPISGLFDAYSQDIRRFGTVLPYCQNCPTNI
jgi:hypothetical protein